MKPVTLDTRQLLGYRTVFGRSQQKLGGKIGESKTLATQISKIGGKVGAKGL